MDRPTDVWHCDVTCVCNTSHVTSVFNPSLCPLTLNLGARNNSTGAVWRQLVVACVDSTSVCRAVCVNW